MEKHFCRLLFEVGYLLSLLGLGGSFCIHRFLVKSWQVKALPTLRGGAVG